VDAKKKLRQTAATKVHDFSSMLQHLIRSQNSLYHFFMIALHLLQRAIEVDKSL
jgi:hypothetical protein